MRGDWPEKSRQEEFSGEKERESDDLTDAMCNVTHVSILFVFAVAIRKQNAKTSGGGVDKQ
jgi:hypothetical protein